MFNLNLIFESGTSKPKLSPTLFDDCECFEDFVIEVCDVLSTLDNSAFIVEGFGLDWNVDVETDLSTIVPQIKDTLMSLRKSETTDIEFFEQGIERKLSLIHI